MPDIERSGTEARLLALLTSTPGQEFHTRDLIRRIHGSPRPVQLALEKLLRQGLVESRRVGPLRMWHMDPGNPVYPALRDLTREQSASSLSSAESLSVRQVFSTRSCSARMRVATTMSAATSTCSSSVSSAVTTFWRDSSRSRRRYAARSIRSYGTSRNSWRERVNGHRSS